MLPDPGLARTQHWLQSFIMEPDGSKPGTLAEADEMATPSRTLTPEQRAGVYRGMYLLRLEEALANDYPVIADYLGEQEFSGVVAGYVRKYPSRSYTLNRLGDHFACYFLGLPGFEQQGMLFDLARFELMVSEVFDAPETPPLSEERIAQVPADAWATAVLKPIAAFRMGRFSHAVGAYKQAYRDSTDYPALKLKTNGVAVFRRDYQVFWRELAEPAYSLLESLVAGRPMGEAIESACLEHGVEEAQLSEWFQEWIASGLFARIELAGN